MGNPENRTSIIHHERVISILEPKALFGLCHEYIKSGPIRIWAKPAFLAAACMVNQILIPLGSAHKIWNLPQLSNSSTLP